MLNVLSYIGDFFKWLWKGITTTVSFVISLPGLVLASVSTLYVSITSLLQVLFEGGGVIDSVTSVGDTAVDNVSSVFEASHSILNLAIYSTSLDIATSVAISIITFIVTFLVATVTLLLVAIPTFLVQYYALKIGAKVLCAVLPSSWVPVQLLDWLRYDASSFLLRHSGEWGIDNRGGMWSVEHS